MDSYDVIIVGAGPAGCVAAEALGKSHRTLLIDQLIFPRNKPCGGVLLEESIDFLKQFEIPEGIFSEPKILKNLVILDLENKIEVKQRRNFWNISRYKFDEFLWKKALENCEFLSGTKLVQFYENGDHVDVIIENEKKERKSLKTKYLIAADGSPSVVRRNIYGAETNMRGYVAAQEWIKPKDNGLEDTYFVYDSKISDFYSWIIPKSKLLIVGAGVPIGQDISKALSYLKENVEIIKGCGSPEIREAKFTFIPNSVDDILLGTKRVLITGEAAGLISPSTGEGLSYALRSGHYAGESIKSSNPQKTYHKLCKPLIEEIGEKMKKYEAMADPAKREEYLRK